MHDLFILLKVKSCFVDHWVVERPWSWVLTRYRPLYLVCLVVRYWLIKKTKSLELSHTWFCRQVYWLFFFVLTKAGHQVYSIHGSSKRRDIFLFFRVDSVVSALSSSETYSLHFNLFFRSLNLSFLRSWLWKWVIHQSLMETDWQLFWFKDLDCCLFDEVCDQWLRINCSRY